MATAQFLPEEWKWLLNAPHWVYAALQAAERGTVLTQRSEAKALQQFLAGYDASSPVLKELIARQDEADDTLEVSLADAERMLGELGTLIERRASLDEGDAIRAFLMSAAQELAAAVREELRPGSTSVSAEEKQILASIAVQLKATEADNLRRHRAVTAAPKPQPAVSAEAARAEAQRQAAAAEAQKQAAAAEAQKQAAAAEAQRQAAAAEAQRQAAAAEAQRQAAAAEAQKQAAAAAAPGTVRIYVVKPGDTLSGIAKQMYGKAARWPEIYEANKDRIKDPNLIRPGWQLRIP